MGKASKAILDGLHAARVALGPRQRVKALIDAAHDWDAVQAAEVESVVRYVCGVGPLPDELTGDFRAHVAGKTLSALSRGRTLDDLDLRALDVIARCQGAYWFVGLDGWLRERVVAFPDEPLFDEALALFRARGLWKTDADVVASMVNHLTGHITEGGALTSTGRWLLARLDADPEAVLRVARAQRRDETPSLFRLLAMHRRARFDALVPTLSLKEDSARSLLAQVMLETDAKAYAAQAVKLVAGLTEPVPALFAVRDVAAHLGDEHLPLLERLLVTAVKAGDVSFVWDGRAASSRQVAVELAWPVLKERASAIWDAFEEPNDALRVRFCETIEAQAGAKALPWLIDALVHRKGATVYGGLTDAKYVAALLKVLAPYDLAPFQARLKKAFAKSKDKRVRELIDGALGARPAARGAARATSFDGKKGYRFDAYADAVVKAALDALKKSRRPLPSPIERVRLVGEQGALRLETLLLEGTGEAVALRLKVATTRVPAHCDLVEDDLLEQFARRHGLAAGAGPAWGDVHALPWCVLVHEQLRAVEAIAEALAKRGAPVSARCKLGVSHHDSLWTSRTDFERRARAEVAALPREQQADFAAVCFERPQRQRWLLGD